MSFSDLIVTKWGAQFQGRYYPVSVGRGGIGEKNREGDNITPRGTFSIENWYVRPDRMGLNFQSLRIRDGWVDDANAPEYNQKVLLPYRGSHERMFRADALYNIVGVVNYNRNPIISGLGSAIFVHIWRRPRYPTEGCIAFDPSDLKHISTNWTPLSKLIIR